MNTGLQKGELLRRCDQTQRGFRVHEAMPQFTAESAWESLYTCECAVRGLPPTRLALALL